MGGAELLADNLSQLKHKVGLGYTLFMYKFTLRIFSTNPELHPTHTGGRSLVTISVSNYSVALVQVNLTLLHTIMQIVCTLFLNQSALSCNFVNLNNFFLTPSPREHMYMSWPPHAPIW